MRGQTREWLDYAAGDLSAAEDMLATGHPSHCMVLCQQAVEKTLKALIIEAGGDEPPRIHSLSRLAQLIGLEMDDDRRSLLADLSNIYFILRYPGEMPADEDDVSAQIAADYLTRSTEVTQWLREQLT